MPDILTRERFEQALRRASDSGPIQQEIRQPTSDQRFREALQSASLPPFGRDQKGRLWSRWHTQIPNHYRLCAKCGRKIAQGYILEPHVTTAICEQHVHQRWV
jgi:hypothetical protein